MRVLMIEDNEDDYRLFSRHIARFDGSQIDWCSTLESSLTFLRENPTVDLVLLDMSLPDGHGLAAFDRVHNQFPALPIIILSGDSTDTVALEAVRRGAQDYLVKGMVDGDMLGRSMRYGIERKQAVEALRRSQESYRLLASNLPGTAVLLFDTDMRYTLVEGSILEKVGYDKNMMIGKRLQEVARDDVRDALEPYYRAALNGEVVNFETQTEGTVFSVQILPMRDAAQGIVGGMLVARDITQEKRSAEALAGERNLLLTLIDSIPDFVYLKDTQSRFMMANKPMLTSGGLTNIEQILGKTDFDFFPSKIAQTFYYDEQRVMRTGRPILNQEEESIDLQTGQPVWYSTTKVPLYDEQGKVSGLLGISRNMTESRRLQTENFDLALERERLLLLSQFVRDTSHDLRTPLTTILTSAYMLRRLPPEKQLDRIEQIEAGVGDINKMLETIHYTAQLWSLNKLHLETVQLDHLLQSVVTRLIGQMNAKKQRFNQTTQAVNIPAEPTYLSQALFEILENAWGYTPENGTITIRLTAQGSTVRLEIEDSGIGMSQEESAKAFDMFWRGDSARVDHTDHHGLGLAIARRIIDLHNGSIEVVSHPGDGSTFIITLPIQTPSNPEFSIAL